MGRKGGEWMVSGLAGAPKIRVKGKKAKERNRG